MSDKFCDAVLISYLCTVTNIVIIFLFFLLLLFSVKIAPGAVVCFESKLRGDITIGSKTIVHPKATIIAETGPIVIGEGNVIEEQAVIINR